MSAETEKTQNHYLSLLRNEAHDSFSCFVEYMTPDEPPAAHHEFFCEKFEAIERRDILRACFSCPPGHAKTKFFSRMGPAWYMGRNPNHKYLQGGHSQAFSENEFGKHVRDLVSDPKYQQVFPGVQLNPKSTAAGNWRLADSRGGYVTKGVGQSIAGYRGNIGGIDDPFGSREDAQSALTRNTTGNWLFTDFRTRLLPNSPLFIVATRWHPDDLIGRVEEMTKKGVGIPWEIYNLVALIENEEDMANDPLGRSMGEALWPEFYSVNELLEIKAGLPSGDWFALYKGKPRDIEGNIVKSAWFKRYDRYPVNVTTSSGFERRVRRITLSLDCAEKATARSDYTVAGVWIEDMVGRHYLVDVLRKRMELTDIITEVEAMAARWNVGTILVEEAGAGIQYLQLRQGKAPAPLIGIKVKNQSKEFRFDLVTPMFEAGEVWLPKKAPWLTDYEAEILAFTGMGDKHDDQVDMTSQYLSWARRRGSYGSKRLKGTRHM